MTLGSTASRLSFITQTCPTIRRSESWISPWNISTQDRQTFIAIVDPLANALFSSSEFSKYITFLSTAETETQLAYEICEIAKKILISQMHWIRDITVSKFIQHTWEEEFTLYCNFKCDFEQQPKNC